MRRYPTCLFWPSDEIQNAADHEFTSRPILHVARRDRRCCWGCDHAPHHRRLLRRLDLHKAAAVGSSNSPATGRSPPRENQPSVAFSADEVYAIAELIRPPAWRRGRGAGSLSPPTRNAQVAMFQNGDVDYLVATMPSAWGSTSDVDTSPCHRTANTRLPVPPLNVEFAQIAAAPGRTARHL